MKKLSESGTCSNLQQSLYSQSNCKIAMNHEWISGRLCETITWSQATSIFYLLDSSCLATCLKYLEALSNSISMPGNTRNALASALFAVLPKWQPIIKPWTDAGGKLSIYPKVPTFMLDVVSESCLLLNIINCVIVNNWKFSYKTPHARWMCSLILQRHRLTITYAAVPFLLP